MASRPPSGEGIAQAKRDRYAPRTPRAAALSRERTLDCNGHDREVPMKTTEARPTSFHCTRRLVALGAWTAMLLCCSPLLDVHGGAVGAVDVSHCSTFSVGETMGTPPRFARSNHTDEVVRRAGLLATRILVTKGYTLEAGGASDLTVRIGAGRREEAVTSEFPMPQPSPSPNGRIETSEREDITAGALVIDVLDGATGKIVWHGAARIAIDPAKIDGALLERATAAILVAFPDRAVSR